MTGAGSLVPYDRLLQTVREARYALQVCQTEGRPEAEFARPGDLPAAAVAPGPGGARDVRVERARAARRVRRGARRPPDPVAAGVPRAQRPVGGRGGRAVRPPAHAAVPDAQGRGADGPRPDVGARPDGAVPGAPRAGTCWRRRTGPERARPRGLAPPYKQDRALSPCGLDARRRD